jgi:DNA-binding NtrC family response regulator
MADSPETSLVLVVDDDATSARYLALALQGATRTRVAASGIDALLCMERELPDVVVSDLQMPGMNGIELLELIKQRWPSIPVVLATVEEDVSLVVEAVQKGAFNYLIKPVAPAVLISVVARALAHAARAEPTLPDDQSEIVGVSQCAVRLRHAVAIAARSDINVVIIGETGTGKELVSRSTHRLAGVAGAPFVPHNCALTPPEMFDSEFFGHRRGAFTGADRDRVGLLRQADRGILFLDELECLSLANQAKLLRVLDDGEVRPVGSDHARPVNVRFLTATNRPPEVLLARGELREDLYYRLRGLEIRVPTLRDRREDIPYLAGHFMRDTALTLTAEAVEALVLCSWPGNIRQLRNVLRAAATRTSSVHIDLQHLDLTGCDVLTEPPPSGRITTIPPSATRSAGSASNWPTVAAHSATLGQDAPHLTGAATPSSLGDAERRQILDTLEHYGGNLSRAAVALGVHRSTLRRKLQRWKVLR